VAARGSTPNLNPCCLLTLRPHLPAGLGVKRDANLALTYYATAFDLGHWKAGYALGQLYMQGERKCWCARIWDCAIELLQEKLPRAAHVCSFHAPASPACRCSRHWVQLRAR
jgi:hypothetical protein